MKTISEIANELGISVQAVHKRIKKILSNPAYKKKLSLCIQKDLKGKMYLDEEGIIILKSSYKLPSSTTSTDDLNLESGLNQPLKPENNSSILQDGNNMESNNNQHDKNFDKPISTNSLNQKELFFKNMVDMVDDGLRDGKNISYDKSDEVDIKKGCEASTGLNRLVDEVEAKQFFNVISDLNKKIQQQELEIKRLNEELSKEREHSREQSNRILTLAEQMTELTRNNQVLLKQEQDKNAKILLLEESKNVVKAHNGFFSRFFNKNNGED